MTWNAYYLNETLHKHFHFLDVTSLKHSKGNSSSFRLYKQSQSSVFGIQVVIKCGVIFSKAKFWKYT